MTMSIADALASFERAGGQAELLPTGKARIVIPANKEARRAASVLRADPLAVRQALRARTAPSLPDRVADWPESLRDLYEERAGIREYDGGMDRQRAEQTAEAEIRQMWASSQ